MKKNLIIASFMLVMIFGCNGKQKTSSDRLDVIIAGLKKGTVVLNKLQNGNPVPVDSVEVKGIDSVSFDLSTYEPQLMTVNLKSMPEKYVLIFTDDTINKVYTSLKNFGINASLHGGENLRQWQAYKSMARQYNDNKLDLIKKRFEAARKKDTATIHQAEKELKGIEKRFKLYALNFAFSNKNLPVGAYVSLVEFHQNPKALDTIYKNFPEKIRQSYYGKEIKKILDSL